MTAVRSSLYVSVVLVVRDDAARAVPLVQELVAVVSAAFDSYELVVVDDGSSDATVEVLRPLLSTTAGLRILRLSRTFGDEVALTAGLETAIGDVVVTMTPADPPALVPTLIGLAHSNGGIVSGVVDAQGQSRSWLRSLASRAYHHWAKRWLGVEVVQDATPFRALSRHALNAVVQIRDKSRYLQVFAPYIGLPITYHKYQLRADSGRPRHLPWVEAANQAVDIIVTSSLRPLRLVTWLGLAASAMNMLYIGYVAAVALWKPHVAEGWITLSLQHAGMFLILSLVLAVMAEYLGRVLVESRDRPLYFVRDEHSSSVLVPIAARRNVVTESV